MSTSRRKLRVNSVTVDLGCSSCRVPRLSNLFHPRTKLRTPTTTNYHKKHSLYHSSSRSWDNVDAHYAYESTAGGSTTFSPANTTFLSPGESDIKSSRSVQGFGRVGGESMAVEKESEDPYLDFRRSMLQMILEKELYSKEDLRELLNCFLQLNSPSYHGTIVRAFKDIWNGVFSVKYAASPHVGHHKSRAF